MSASVLSASRSRDGARTRGAGSKLDMSAWSTIDQTALALKTNWRPQLVELELAPRPGLEPGTCGLAIRRFDAIRCRRLCGCPRFRSLEPLKLFLAASGCPAGLPLMFSKKVLSFSRLLLPAFELATRRGSTSGLIDSGSTSDWGAVGCRVLHRWVPVSLPDCRVLCRARNIRRHSVCATVLRDAAGHPRHKRPGHVSTGEAERLRSPTAAVDPRNGR